jgi:hypothetical protein
MIGLKDVIDSFGEDTIRALASHESGCVDAGEAACLWAEAVGTTPLWDQFLEAIETIRNS